MHKRSKVLRDFHELTTAGPVEIEAEVQIIFLSLHFVKRGPFLGFCFGNASKKFGTLLADLVLIKFKVAQEIIPPFIGRRLPQIQPRLVFLDQRTQSIDVVPLWEDIARRNLTEGTTKELMP